LIYAQDIEYLNLCVWIGLATRGSVTLFHQGGAEKRPRQALSGDAAIKFSVAYMPCNANGLIGTGESTVEYQNLEGTSYGR
jgi:hypothetical protein